MVYMVELKPIFLKYELEIKFLKNPNSNRKVFHDYMSLENGELKYTKHDLCFSIEQGFLNVTGDCYLRGG